MNGSNEWQCIEKPLRNEQVQGPEANSAIFTYKPYVYNPFFFSTLQVSQNKKLSFNEF